MSEPRPIAAEDAVTKEWWVGTTQRRLLVQRCGSCGHHQFYPRTVCVACGSVELLYVQTSGRATIYSFTTVMRAPHPAFEPPYVVAVVRLEEGPTMLTTILAEEDNIACDMAVQLTWHDLEDGRRLPMFTP